MKNAHYRFNFSLPGEGSFRYLTIEYSGEFFYYPRRGFFIRFDTLKGYSFQDRELIFRIKIGKYKRAQPTFFKSLEDLETYSLKLFREALAFENLFKLLGKAKKNRVEKSNRELYKKKENLLSEKITESPLFKALFFGLSPSNNSPKGGLNASQGSLTPKGGLTPLGYNLPDFLVKDFQERRGIGEEKGD